MPTKKQTLSFPEFLEKKRIELQNPKIKRIDWDLRKKEWLDAVERLYNYVDTIIVTSLIAAGYDVKTEKDEIKISEDFIGSYIINNYTIRTEQFKIYFNPLGTINYGFHGQVDMVMPTEKVKLVLTEKNEWKIVKALSVPMELMEFNEKNIQKIFEENL